MATPLARGHSAPAAQSLDSDPEAVVRGAMTVVELLKRHKDGRAIRLFGDLYMSCAHCGGAFHEPLTMAAKRHRRSPRAFLDACRALDDPGWPTAAQIDAARAVSFERSHRRSS